MGSASSAAPWYCSGRRAVPKEGSSDELRIGSYRPPRSPHATGRRDGGKCKAEGRFRPGAYCPVREERTRPDNAAVAPYRRPAYECGEPERDISRILSSPARAAEVMIISLGPRLPEASSDLTRGRWAGHPSLRRYRRRTSSYLVLLRVGFAVPPWSPSGRWALTPPFHPYPGTVIPWRCVFCGTFRLLTEPPRYGAPCPSEFGLSSPAKPERSSVPLWRAGYYKRPSTPIANLRRRLTSRVAQQPAPRLSSTRVAKQPA